MKTVESLKKDKIEMIEKEAEKIVIDQEFQNLISTLNDSEYAELEKSILAEGCRDALVLWGDILIDGHNRYKICTEHGIEFQTIQREFDTRETAKDWMIRNQLGRRNLTLEQRNYFIGKLYQEQKQAHGGDRKSKGNNFPLKSTAQKIAEEQKVTDRTVKNAEGFAQAVDTIATNTDTEARKKILNRDIQTTAKEVSALAKQPADFQKKVIATVLGGKTKSVKKAIKQVKQEQRVQANEVLEVQAKSDKTKPYRLICGDFAEVAREIEAQSVDVIITDPPYSRKHLPLYETLAKESARILKSNGSVLVMAGQSYLPEVFQLMVPHLSYHWLVAYLTPGGQAVQLWQKEVNTFWKPVLWFVNGRYNGEWVSDVAKSEVNDNDKRFHNWGQSESGIKNLVEKFSKPGDVILDPFVGGGTVGIVAVTLNRKFIGIDIDAQAIETTQARLFVCSVTHQ